MKNFIKAVITLFKAVPIVKNPDANKLKLDNESNVQKGFFITEEAFKACPIDEEILKFIEDKFGYNIFELNQGFYKSFQTVTELSPQQILANKLLHYMSTYSFEQLGIFSHDTVFIPHDALELPADSKPIKLTVINAISNEEIKTRTEKMVMSGIAFADETLENLTTIIKQLKIKLNIDNVPNKELRVRLCDLLNIMPKNPIEFLRFVIFKISGSTLLIKSPETILKIKSSVPKPKVKPETSIKPEPETPRVITPPKFDDFLDEYMMHNDIDKLNVYAIHNDFDLSQSRRSSNVHVSYPVRAPLKPSKKPKSVDEFFERYIAANGIQKLAEVFHRYKPLWLAFKRYSKYMRTTINKVRKLADKYHKPMKTKLLDTVTSNPNINVKDLKNKLLKVSVFKRISLANAILFRIAKPENIAYMIRNGKIFVEDYDKKFEPNNQTLLTVMESIVEVVRPNVEGKKIYLPEKFIYAAPTSEKKFIGEIPYGSVYNFESQSAIVGVHWFNLPDSRVDLDLHLNSAKRSIGWYNDFYDRNFIDTKNETVIFSGDMTDAPIDKGGATEAYFIGESAKDEMMMFNLNRYTSNNAPVPFKLILGDVKEGKIDRKYLINSHEVAFCLPSKIEEREMFIGFLYSDEDGNKNFYFTEAETCKRIVSYRDRNAFRMIEALQTSLESCLKLKDILKDAGAIFEKDDDEEWDINLDPQVITKDTILNLFAKVSD